MVATNCSAKFPRVDAIHSLKCIWKNNWRPNTSRQCVILIWNNGSFSPCHFYPNMNVYSNVERKCAACNSMRRVWQFKRNKIECGRAKKKRNRRWNSSDLIRFVNVYMVCMPNTDDEPKKERMGTHIAHSRIKTTRIHSNRQ